MIKQRCFSWLLPQGLSWRWNTEVYSMISLPHAFGTVVLQSLILEKSSIGFRFLLVLFFVRDPCVPQSFWFSE